MNKSTLLGIINIIFVLWFSYILATSVYTTDAFVSFYVAFRAYVSHIVILLLLIMNASLAYTLLIKKPKKISYAVVASLTFSSLFWFVFSFIGFFFVSNFLFPVIALMFAIFFYLFFKKYSKKLALYLSLGTILAMTLVIFSSFEEDYCWNQGTLADPSGTKSVQATKEDAKDLAGHDVQPGQQIGVAFRAHMQCHNTFNFIKAVQDNYFSN